MRSYPYLFLAPLLILVGCQSSMVRSFEKVHAGMDKHQVLETMGSPDSTTRMHGKDRWIYRFYDDGIRHDKEVHFLDGSVIYSGEPMEPPKGKTARDKDIAVEEQEKEYVIQEQIKKKQKAEAIANYESEIRGDKKVKYMPAFSELK